MVWTSTKTQLADELSRKLSLSECKLRPQLREAIIKRLLPNLDLFATWHNRLHGEIRYVSRYPEEKACETNGLAYTPNTDDVIYAFPPWNLAGPAAKAVLKLAKKSILVYTIIDCCGPEVPFLQSMFEHTIKITKPAILRPSKRLHKVDETEDYFRLANHVKETFIFLNGFSVGKVDQFRNELHRIG